MMSFLFYLAMIFNGVADTIKEDYRIDYNQKAGKFLIYQCEEKHFTCVDEVSFQKCIEQRKKAKANKLQNKLECAPLKPFENKLKCIEESYRLIEKNFSKPFCIK